MATARTRRAAIATTAPAFSAQDVRKILELAKNSRSVELKLSVPLSGQRATIDSIGLDPVEAQPRQVYFFDTADRALNRAGLIVRARRIQGGRADTVVKLRPVDPATIAISPARFNAWSAVSKKYTCRGCASTGSSPMLSIVARCPLSGTDNFSSTLFEFLASSRIFLTSCAEKAGAVVAMAVRLVLAVATMFVPLRGWPTFKNVQPARRGAGHGR